MSSIEDAVVVTDESFFCRILFSRYYQEDYRYNSVVNATAIRLNCQQSSKYT